MLGNIGPMEMVFLMIILLLIFGAKRLPELGSGLGKGIREFKKSMRDINTEIDRPLDSNNVQPPAQRPAVPSATSETKDNI